MAAVRLRRRRRCRTISVCFAPTRVGRYALRIVFSDGHDSGLYNWDLIRKLTVGDEAVTA
jgi:DUF971 family protein